MVVDMELQEAKDEVLQLMKNKDKIESEIKSLKGVLESNRVTMDESLVDHEGYPRTDIDVYQVRHTRHKIICLTNDYKALMKQIEQGLIKVHGLSKGEDSHIVPSTNETIQSSSLEPFLRINLVSPNSPAEFDGIQVGDLILEFGSINYKNYKSLKDISTVVEHSENKKINLKIKRESNILCVALTPRVWIGKGLLGCNVIPEEIVER